ncbi:MAG: hypothetical protein ABIG95_01560 [Candidatus Woesearchaeota archaeon]
MKKSAILIFIFLIILISNVYSQGPVGSPTGTPIGNPFAELGTIVTSAIQIIVQIFMVPGTMSIDQLIALLRFGLWLMVFTIFHWGTTKFITNKRVCLIISLCIAVMVMLLTPSDLLRLIAVQYTSLVLLPLLFGVPVFIVWAMYVKWKPTNKMEHFIRALIIMALIWIVSRIDLWARSFPSPIFIPLIVSKLTEKWKK